MPCSSNIKIWNLASLMKEWNKEHQTLLSIDLAFWSFLFSFFLQFAKNWAKDSCTEMTLLTRRIYTRQKQPKSTWQPNSIHVRHEISLLRLHGHFGLVYLLQVKFQETFQPPCFFTYSHLSNKRAAWLIDFWVFVPPACLFLCSKSLFFMY